MSRAQAASPEPIEGVSVPGSRITPLVGLTVGLVASPLAGMALAIWWATGVEAPVKGLLACAAGVFLGLGVSAWAVRELCVPRRLILGQEALQVVRGRRRILLHIPYANVAGVAYEKRDAARSIRFDLIAPVDPATYGPRLGPTGRAIELPLMASNLPVYAGKPKVIFDAVELRVEEFRSRHGS